MTLPGHCAVAFGMLWQSDLRLEYFADWQPSGNPPALGEVKVCRGEQLRERRFGRPINHGLVYPDGVRLRWRDEVVFDMFDGRVIEYVPGPGWRSTLPNSFFGTMVGLTAAWRGALPLHACAVEIDGRAFLIAGGSGAGKSSLAAGLLALGGDFVADDLTVVRANGRTEVLVFPGRMTMRQHAATAATIASHSSLPIAGDERRKWLVRPSARTKKACLPLGGILVLCNRSESAAEVSQIELLAQNLFRPRWMAALPSYPLLRRDLLALTAAVKVELFPEIDPHRLDIHIERAEQAMRVLRTMLAC